MSVEKKIHFKFDKDKCTMCGKCINTCSRIGLSFDKEGYPVIKEFERFG